MSHLDEPNRLHSTIIHVSGLLSAQYTADLVGLDNVWVAEGSKEARLNSKQDLLRHDLIIHVGELNVFAASATVTPVSALYLWSRGPAATSLLGCHHRTQEQGL